jgi:hypothetical protein
MLIGTFVTADDGGLGRTTVGAAGKELVKLDNVERGDDLTTEWQEHVQDCSNVITKAGASPEWRVWVSGLMCQQMI